MTDAGFFSLWLSRVFGGPEFSLTAAARVIEELSRADGSMGWCATAGTALSRLSGSLSECVARNIFCGGEARLAGGLNPTGKAVAVPGGFRLTGCWGYGSFIEHSHWTVGGAFVHDGDVLRRDAAGVPDMRFMIFPTAAVEVIDTWHVSGLRGTGSHDFRVREFFVADDYALSAFTAAPLQPGTLYATPISTTFAAAIACVSIGIARAAIDSYDNALAETINGLYKAEVIWRQRSWLSASAVEMATLNWVEWFNNHRLFGPIGHIPPAEAEANYYATIETLDMVA